MTFNFSCNIQCCWQSWNRETFKLVLLLNHCMALKVNYSKVVTHCRKRTSRANPCLNMAVSAKMVVETLSQNLSLFTRWLFGFICGYMLVEECERFVFKPIRKLSGRRFCIRFYYESILLHHFFLPLISRHQVFKICAKRLDLC